jgi:hypothetical protein
VPTLAGVRGEVESATLRQAVLTFPLGADLRSGSPPWVRWVPRIRILAIAPRSQAIVAILVVEGLPATASQDTVVILNKLRAVGICNRRTTPTMPNITRVNTPSKQVPERRCSYPNTLTLLSTFLTEQGDEDHPQFRPRLPGSSLGIPHPASWRLLTTVLMFSRYLFRAASRSSRLCSRLPFISNILFFVPHASRIVAYTVLTWLLSILVDPPTRCH